MTGQLYLIWSAEWRLWWRPGRSGYTDAVDQAGRYSRQEASQICPGHPRAGNPNQAGPWEIPVLAPESGGIHPTAAQAERMDATNGCGECS